MKFSIAIVSLLMLISSCNMFKNVLRSKQRSIKQSTTEQSYNDNSVIETMRQIDTNILISSDSARLRTSIAQLILRPVQIVQNNGISLELRYDSTTGILDAKALQTERFIPVKISEHTKTTNDISQEHKITVKQKERAKQSNATTTVNWTLVIVVVIAMVLLFLFIFISKKL